MTNKGSLLTCCSQSRRVLLEQGLRIRFLYLRLGPEKLFPFPFPAGRSFHDMGSPSRYADPSSQSVYLSALLLTSEKAQRFQNSSVLWSTATTRNRNMDIRCNPRLPCAWKVSQSPPLSWDYIFHRVIRANKCVKNWIRWSAHCSLKSGTRGTWSDFRTGSRPRIGLWGSSRFCWGTDLLMNILGRMRREESGSSMVDGGMVSFAPILIKRIISMIHLRFYIYRLINAHSGQCLTSSSSCRQCHYISRPGLEDPGSLARVDLMRLKPHCACQSVVII